MAHEISLDSINKYRNFLTIIKEREGRELDLVKVIKGLRLNSSAHYYAKSLGLIDFKGKQILKADYHLGDDGKVEPIVARRLAQHISDSIVAYRNKRADNPTVPKITNDVDLGGKQEVILPAKTVDDVVREPVREEAPLIHQAPGHKKIAYPMQTTNANRSFKLKLFSIPIVQIEW